MGQNGWVAHPSSTPILERFDHLICRDDRVEINNLLFRLQVSSSETAWEAGDQCFSLYKGVPMLQQYRGVFERNPQLQPKSILEMGIYECGSVALWNEIFEPSHFSAIDLRQEYCTPYTNAYFKKEPNVHLHWQFDQTDCERLRTLVDTELNGSLDMVIDDASHQVTPTIISFETLFPLVKPGGIYVIEDWNWGHLPAFQDMKHPWAENRSPSEVAFELLEAVGSNDIGVDHLEVWKAFIVLFRNDTKLPAEFRLRDYIVRRPHNSYTWFNA